MEPDRETIAILLLQEAQKKLEAGRYSEMPLAHKIGKFLNTPSITWAELDQEYRKALKTYCGIES